MSSQWSLPFESPNQNPVNTSPLLHACHVSHPPHHLRFNHPNNIRSYQRISPVPRRFETFRNALFFTVRIRQPHTQSRSWRTTSCRLSTTAYSIYSPLPSISGVLLLHPQPEDAPCRGDKFTHTHK